MEIAINPITTPRTIASVLSELEALELVVGVPVVYPKIPPLLSELTMVLELMKENVLPVLSSRGIVFVAKPV